MANIKVSRGEFDSSILDSVAGLPGGNLGSNTIAGRDSYTIEATSTQFSHRTLLTTGTTSWTFVGEGLVYNEDNLPIGGVITSIVRTEANRLFDSGRVEITDIRLDASQFLSGNFGKLAFAGVDTAEVEMNYTGFSGIISRIETGDGDDVLSVTPNSPGTNKTTSSRVTLDGGEGDNVFNIPEQNALGGVVQINTGGGKDVIVKTVSIDPELVVTPIIVGAFDPQSDVFELQLSGDFSGGTTTFELQQDGGDAVLVRTSVLNSGEVVSVDNVIRLQFTSVEDLVFEDNKIVGASTLPPEPATPVFGTEGADVLFGNPDSNIIVGLGGNDAIFTYENDDVLIGGEGNDSLDAGAGKDQLFGGNGNDQMFAGDGDDVAFGGAGDDLIVGDAQHGGGDDGLFGEDGNDVVYASRGSDFVSGGNGDDVLFGETGNDEINGDAGNDTLFGGSDQDVLNGGDGADSLDGGTENDKLYGGADDDQLFGGAGDDYISGGNGNDLLVGDAEGTSGADTLYGNAGNDIVYAGFGNDIINGGGGDDFLFGETGNDRILGGYGNDVILGGTGNDALSGGQGDDVIDGGTGNDSLDGGAGNDTLFAGEGTLGSTLNGNAGNDILRGGEGRDQLIGGSGFDIVSGGASVDLFHLKVGHDLNIWQDFEDGIDRIVVGSGDPGPKPSFADLRIFETLDGTGTWIGYEDTQLILEGVDADLIDEEDFSFS